MGVLFLFKKSAQKQCVESKSPVYNMKPANSTYIGLFIKINAVIWQAEIIKVSASLKSQWVNPLSTLFFPVNFDSREIDEKWK